MKINYLSQFQSVRDAHQSKAASESKQSFTEHIKLSRLADRDQSKRTSEVDKISEQVREASEQLVASAFVLPILQKMQEDPFKSELFHGGSAEDMFAQQWNTHVADDVVKRANFPMVDAVYNQIMKRANLLNEAHSISQKVVDINA